MSTRISAVLLSVFCSLAVIMTSLPTTSAQESAEEGTDTTTVASIKEHDTINFPNLVYVRGDRPVDHVCMAAILTARWIVTSTACAMGSLETMTVRSNSSYWHKEGKLHRVLWRSERPGADISLLRVEEPFVLPEGMMSISVPRGWQAGVNFEPCLMTLWTSLRDTSGSTETTHYIHKVMVRGYDRFTCEPRFKINIGTQEVCMAPVSTQESIGRVSGPLICNEQLVGTISYNGRSWGKSDYATNLAHIPNIKLWIFSETSEKESLSNN